MWLGAVPQYNLLKTLETFLFQKAFSQQILCFLMSLVLVGFMQFLYEWRADENSNVVVIIGNHLFKCWSISWQALNLMVSKKQVSSPYRHFYHTIVLQVRCLKWQVVCSLNRTQGCWKQQQGYLFQMNTVIPHKTSQQAHARLVNYT